MKNCSPEFKKKNVPGLPKDISAAVSMCFETVYAPQDEGDDNCLIQIESTDSSAPLVTIKLQGGGTYETEQTDIFTQVSGQEVDILLVIDDSGSMCGEQDKLVAAYKDFISHAAVWDNDYHIGIISSNVVDDRVVGMLNYGPEVGKSPRYITPESGADKFEDLADLGCDGGPHCGGLNGPCTDEQESGLQAAQVALSAPLTTETGVACSSDADCHNNPSVCPDPAACKSVYCLDGTCGGWNKGFLREDAQLEIIELSDEEDQSSADVYFYIDFLKSIKGFYNVNMMHVNSIVGANPTTCDESAPGKRYIKVSQDTNGKIGDICDDSYSPIMNEIGGQTFGLKVQFFLTRLADPPTVQVWVNGDSCATGWTYDAPSNSIIFQEDGSCMPQPGDEIKVHYKTLCLTE
ncbi:MAG: VWA domain-containing protein [Deltaproteobacteria bacterium]|nr:VWA domain-containing protein [Deltaproteobacteria bacterium]